jgi:hypothetical protein
MGFVGENNRRALTAPKCLRFEKVKSGKTGMIVTFSPVREIISIYHINVNL